MNTNSIRNFISKIPSQKRRALLIILLFAFIGVLIITFSYATTSTTNIEAENGTLSSQAKKVSGSDKSAGYGVKFNTPCIYTAPTPADQWGGMTYVNYHFNQNDIYELDHDIDVINNTDSTTRFYIQLYDGDIGAEGQYYGIQTSGFVIWSQWGTNDTTNIRPDNGATALNGVETGSNFISLRKDHGSLPAGHYKTRMLRAEFDRVGDWWKYYVTFPGQAEEHIGDMRFARKTAGVKASFNDGGGQWNEFWGNNGSTLQPVPELHLNVSVKANGSIEAVHAEGSYQKMPNSDMYAVSPPGGYVHHDIGATTPRCHFPPASGYLPLW